MSDAATLLEVGHLSVRYGKVEAVHDVSLSAGEGRIATVIGPNGAGKTTLLAAIMGLMPSEGTIAYRGEPLAGLPVEARVARGPGARPEKARALRVDERRRQSRARRVRASTRGRGRDPARTRRGLPPVPAARSTGARNSRGRCRGRAPDARARPRD
jgi:branched-chain amino acid transport system ATP-binding protein